MLDWQEVDTVLWYFEGRCEQKMLYSKAKVTFLLTYNTVKDSKHDMHLCIYSVFYASLKSSLISMV